MREAVREQVVVERSPSAAWDHMARLEAWPSWAGHIRAMDPEPPGELTESTAVVLDMRAGPKVRMVVTEYDPPHSWVWEGHSFGTTTRFEHRFEQVADERTRIWFLAWMDGPMAGLAAWAFGKVMHRNLSVALPRLKSEMEEM